MNKNNTLTSFHSRKVVLGNSSSVLRNSNSPHPSKEHPKTCIVGWKLTNIILLLLFIFQATAISAAKPDSVFNHPLKKERTLFNATMNSLKTSKLIAVSFAQTKKIESLSRPLKSSGYILIGSKEVCIKTQNPIESSMKVSQKGIWQQNGNKTKFVKSDKNIKTRYMVNIMMALFKADQKTLSESFDIYFHIQGQTWTIGLKPKSKQFSKVIFGIVLSGSKNELNNISIIETSKNKTIMQFSPLKKTPNMTLKNCVL